MKTPLGTEVDLGLGHIVLDVLDVVPAVRERGTATLLFSPMSIVATVRSPLSATAELLFHPVTVTEGQGHSTRQISTLCLKNVPHFTCYNLDVHGSITIIFGTSVTEKVGNQHVLYFPTSRS